MRPLLGAHWLGDIGTSFLVWAPAASKVELRLVTPADRLLPMQPETRGYFRAAVEDAGPGTRYFYRLNGAAEYPDPASRLQPEGVHGPSEVVDPTFAWQSPHWSGLPLQEYITYELHVGAFTPEGTFDAVASRLDHLTALGVTALELMPVAQFPGSRNWGYDGVYPFAPQYSYGGPRGLRRLVDACHRAGLAVVLDVVYNHLGPEGNYLSKFGPYFTDTYHTPWGKALNFDGPHSDEVRRFFIENAIYWVTGFRIDALRLDAVHTILDHSPVPFLQELAQAVHEQADRLNRRIYVISETPENDARLLRPAALGGYGLDAQWNDDFHHALRTLLTREKTGYYQDYGGLRHLLKAYREGYVYTGEYSAYRRRKHGSSARDLAGHQLVVFAQNHDQVGNRSLSERLGSLVSFEQLKLAAAAVLLAPFLPLLFMGEEYAETAPFQYFVNHGDRELVEAVRRGRRQEFAAFGWKGECPDPQDEATFLRSKLDAGLRNEGCHHRLLEFYRELIRLRRAIPALGIPDKSRAEINGFEREKVLCLRRWRDRQEVFAVFHFGDSPAAIALPVPAGRWRKILDSSDSQWAGRGSALDPELTSAGEVTLPLASHALVVYLRELED